MEKTARKPSTDPAQEKLRQNKANWNKEVSAFVNDLIHFKKMMNGWPSKFFKERSRITQPIPADPATVIGSLAGDFQEIVNKGNSLIQEQVNYAKVRRQRQPKQLNLPLQQPEGAPAAPEAPKPPTPDLSKQLQLGLAASTQRASLIKLADEFENKYLLESQASNPFSRFIFRLFNPKLGFGEGARIRGMRRTLLDSCLDTYRTLKQVEKEIVKSSSGSLEKSYNLMTSAMNHWNIAYRLFSTYKMIRPDAVKDEGGKMEKRVDEERDPESDVEERQGHVPNTVDMAEGLARQAKDYKQYSPGIKTNSPAFRELNSTVESIMAAPQNKRISALLNSGISGLYQKAIQEVNGELGTSGNTFAEIVAQVKSKPPVKEAQFLGKIRHQLIPGATSSSRLEVSRFVEQVKKDLDHLMNLLEDGFDQEALTKAISQTHKNISLLRTMVRALYFSQNPKKAPPPPFF